MKKYISLVIMLVVMVNVQSCLLFDTGYYEDYNNDNTEKPKKTTSGKTSDKGESDNDFWAEIFKDQVTKPSKKPKYKDDSTYIKPNPIGNSDENKFNLSKLEKDIIAELNLVRANPSNYATRVMKKYSNMSEAAYECYSELLRSKNMQPLEASEGLYKAALWFVEYQGKTGEVGHSASISGYREPWDRMAKFGVYYGGCAENISYGYNTAREIVLQLLIDDGIPNRGHRRNILNPSFSKIGVATGKHKKYRYLCVMDFANSYKSY